MADADSLISRQRRWQLKKSLQGLCMTCGKPKVTAQRCLIHAVKEREYDRVRKGSVRRNTNAWSYQMEKNETN